MGVLLPTALGRESLAMLCIRPFKVRPGQEFGCGQCLPCRINRRRVWTARLVLEGLSYGSSSAFLTLTYRNEFLPVGGNLVPGDLEEFRYKLRYVIGPFRYYFVGEYGEKRKRPHYHCLIFGWFPTDCYVDEFRRLRSRCIDSVWSKGVHDVGELTSDSAGYCAGYVVKKWTKKEVSSLAGRVPEFGRMSRKPGLGVPGLSPIVAWLYSAEGAAYVQRTHDVPSSVRIGGKIFPLGRYLVAWLRRELGIESQDSLRSLRSEALRLENMLPEVVDARELKREGHYQRAKFYVELRKSKEVM